MRTDYLIPTNLYGPHDSFDPEDGHVIPAMIRKFAEADDVVELWGTGTPTRDFLYVADAARGIADCLSAYTNGDPINLGSGRETSIASVAELVADTMGFKGSITWNYERPDGTLRRLLDTERARKTLGWKPRISLEDGIEQTVSWYLEQQHV
jgi:nucleoside-diphosphate-sugar epimerase